MLNQTINVVGGNLWYGLCIGWQYLQLPTTAVGVPSTFGSHWRREKEGWAFIKHATLKRMEGDCLLKWSSLTFIKVYIDQSSLLQWFSNDRMKILCILCRELRKLFSHLEKVRLWRWDGLDRRFWSGFCPGRHFHEQIKPGNFRFHKFSSRNRECENEEVLHNILNSENCTNIIWYGDRALNLRTSFGFLILNREAYLYLK